MRKSAQIADPGMNMQLTVGRDADKAIKTA